MSLSYLIFSKESWPQICNCEQVKCFINCPVKLQTGFSRHWRVIIIIINQGQAGFGFKSGFDQPASGQLAGVRSQT